jgi:hypothetical protein
MEAGGLCPSCSVPRNGARCARCGAAAIGRKAPEDVLGPDLRLRLDHLKISPGFRAFLGRLTARRGAARPASAAEGLGLLDSPGTPRVRPGFVVALAATLALAAWLAVGSALTSLRATAGAERVRRAEIEALQRGLTAPYEPAPTPTIAEAHRDISLGQYLSGAKLRELDPELPSCYRRAGIELARVRHWPEQKAMQLKVVLHSQEPDCDWLPLGVTASAEGGRALRSTGTHGDAPREGWRDVFYDFDLPGGVHSVRLEVSGPTRPLEAWRIDLDRPEVRRAGYALAGSIEVPLARVDLPTLTGCARFERGSFETIWIEQDPDGGKRLDARATFSTRKDSRKPCRQKTRLVLLDSRPRLVSTTPRLDSDRTLTFTLPLPEGRGRLRVALGEPLSRAAAILRIDLQDATAEPDAIAAVTP